MLMIVWSLALLFVLNALLVAALLAICPGERPQRD